MLRCDSIANIEAYLRFFYCKSKDDPPFLNTRSINLDISELDDNVIRNMCLTYKLFMNKWIIDKKNILVIYSEDLENLSYKITNKIIEFLEIDKLETKHIAELANILKKETNFKIPNKNYINIYNHIKKIYDSIV